MQLDYVLIISLTKIEKKCLALSCDVKVHVIIISVRNKADISFKLVFI